MGKTEKIVVLSILFLVVVLFVWSMGGDGVDAADRGGSNDAKSARYSGAVDPSGASPKKGKDSDGASAGSASDPASDPSVGAPMGAGHNGASGEGMLLKRPGAAPNDSTGQPGSPIEIKGSTRRNSGEAGGAPGSTAGEAEPLVPRRQGGTLRQGGVVHMRPGWDLLTTDGLEATVNPDVLLFRPKDGDTWASLAQDFFGDSSKESLLRHNNEGMQEPGKIVFIPAKDDDASEVDTRVVEVLKGETLWQVSKRTLGRGSRWRELFEANRGVISDPDYLAPGTILTVPAQ